MIPINQFGGIRLRRNDLFIRAIAVIREESNVVGGMREVGLIGDAADLREGHTVAIGLGVVGFGIGYPFFLAYSLEWNGEIWK